MRDQIGNVKKNVCFTVLCLFKIALITDDANVTDFSG